MSDMNTSTGAPKRPTFLTVLCILSFIGGAWGIIGGIMSMTASAGTEALSQMANDMDAAKAGLGDDAASGIAGDMMDATAQFAIKAASAAKSMGIANIVLCIVSLLGVWMMWNLKKNGFYLYTLATIGGLAVPLIFLGVNLLSILSVGLGGLVGVVFIILYGLNLKHMS
jgi:hypothetical protein